MVELQLIVISDVIGQIAGVLGLFVITVGLTIAIVRFVVGLFFEQHTAGENIPKRHVDPIRVGLGRFINLGLEFLIAKDALETIFTRSWDDLTQLLLLVIIRTIVTFFLMYEIESIEHIREAPAKKRIRRRVKRTAKNSA